MPSTLFSSRGLRLLSFLSLVYVAFAAVLPTRDDSNVNTTITVSGNVTNHGDPNLFCTPTKWTDIVVFFFGNYVAHATTVVTYPGEPGFSVLASTVLGLIYPITGALRGLTAIFRHAAFKKDPREKALQAGALCMVVRLPEWRPVPGEKLEGLTYVSDNLSGKLRHYYC